jgi:Iodothyronine deiodinase
MGINIREKVLFANPKTGEERGNVASTCVRTLGIEAPALVDDMRNSVETAYTGWPDRLYVIDRAGRVAYKSKPGPFGFHPVEAERALAALVERP